MLAKVAELADAPDLGSGPARGGGSSPPFRTILSFQSLVPPTWYRSITILEHRLCLGCVWLRSYRRIKTVDEVNIPVRHQVYILVSCYLN